MCKACSDHIHSAAKRHHSDHFYPVASPAVVPVKGPVHWHNFIDILLENPTNQSQPRAPARQQNTTAHECRGSQGSSNQHRDSNPRGVDSNPRGVESNPRGVESNPRGVESNPRGVESNPRGVESNPRGVESNPRGVESNQRGVESNPRGVESNPRGVESNPRGMDSNPNPKGGGATCIKHLVISGNSSQPLQVVKTKVNGGSFERLSRVI